MRSGGSSKRSAAAARDQHDFDAGQCRDARCQRCRIGGRRQVDGRERAERAVVDDVRIGDRQDHARRAGAEPRRRARPAGR